jgi:serine/threonine-protein kinase SRPK3
LNYLERHSRGELSSNYVVQLLDAFTHEGPNGVHQCLVFELLGPSVDKVLADYHEGHDKLCSETILRTSTQLLKAVKFIHSAGVCHGGEVASPLHLCASRFHCTHILLDISGRNIAFSCTHLWRQTEEQLFDVLGFPEVEPLTQVDGTPLGNGLPSQLVKQQNGMNG